MDTFLNEKVYIDEGTHSIYVELTEGEDAPFLTMRDVFLAAASLGKRCKELEKKKDVFTKGQLNDQHKALIYALAINYTSDLEKALENPLIVVEKLANEGIDELYYMVKKNGGDGIGNLVEEILLEYC